MDFAVALCDDELIILKMLELYLSQISLKEEIEIVAEKFQSPENLIKKVKENPGRYHALCLDIEMSEMNGIEVAKIIR
ncbi:MAG: response regulator, partial [Eubacteriaceae bacterium]